MEPQVSRLSWRAPCRCTRLLILYLSAVKKELLTGRKGYLIINFRAPTLAITSADVERLSATSDDLDPNFSYRVNAA